MSADKDLNIEKACDEEWLKLTNNTDTSWEPEPSKDLAWFLGILTFFVAVYLFGADFVFCLHLAFLATTVSVVFRKYKRFKYKPLYRFF